MTVAAAVAAVAPAGSEGKHGIYVDADEQYHRQETIAAAAAATACHRRETSVAAATAAAASAAACHRRETSVAAVAAAATACHRREVTVVPSLASASPDPPGPKTPADDKSMRVRGFRRRTRRRPLFRNFVGLSLGVGGTDGVF